MDEKTLASIEASNMLGFSKTYLESDSTKHIFIPLRNLANKNVKSKSSLQEIQENIKKLKLSFVSNSRIECEPCSKSEKISVKSNEKNLSGDSQKHGFDAINGFLPPLHHPDRQKMAIQAMPAEDYVSIEKEIYANIKYPYRRLLIVWCPTLDVESELVHALLKENAVFVYDRWIHKDKPNVKNAWGGVVAVYPDTATAKKAAKEIPCQHESLKTIRFSALIDYFIKSELKYFSEEKIQVLVHGKVSGRENVQKLEVMLRKFGQVEFCRYDYLIRNAAVNFSVTYTYATHAFLAQTVLDNFPFGSSLLDVEIKTTLKTKAILNDIRFQLRKNMGNMHFPF